MWFSLLVGWGLSDKGRSTALLLSQEEGSDLFGMDTYHRFEQRRDTRGIRSADSQ